MGGRPKDPFWEYVIVLDADSTRNRQVKCKFCNTDFKGGATRIKKHLSGFGGEVRPCGGDVPDEIKKKALDAVHNIQRRRPNTMEIEVNNAVNRVLERGETSSAPALNANFTTTNEVGGECVSDLLVRFLKSRNVPVDVIKDSDFQNLLKSIPQNSATIEKPLLTFEQEMNQKMLIIKLSWKLTGCSFIIYNLKQGAREHNELLVGFYCPRGFIFVGVSLATGKNRFDKRKEILNALTNHEIGCTFEDVVLAFEHFPSHIAECHYHERHLTDDFSLSDFFSGRHFFIDSFISNCIKHEIESFCKRACEKSIWLQSLIRKSEKIYEYVVNCSLYEKFHNTLKEKRVIAVGETVISISRLGLVMEIELELRSFLLSLPIELERYKLEIDFKEIITDHEFWGDGNALMRALMPLLSHSSTHGYLSSNFRLPRSSVR